MLNANTNDGKRFVIIIALDDSGCSHYRLRWNSLYFGGHGHLGFTPILLPCPLYDPSILAATKAVIIQRPISDPCVEWVKRYKALQPKFNFKLIFEVDDQVFNIDGKCVPEYNTAHFSFDGNKVTENCRKVLPYFDEVVVSTDYLKRKMEEIFDVHNITVIRNVVPRFLWSYPRKKPITEDLKKPIVVYSGSPCHYRNPVPPRAPSPQEPNGFGGIGPLKGDMDNAWCDWIIKAVREDRINFICMGSLPWFWEPIKDKIKVINWVDCNSFPRQVMETNADFSFAPLVENAFNKCKSSLRFTESCAAGHVFMGTVFEDSPYNEVHPMSQFKTNVTVDEIDARFNELCKKENYNKILEWQYNFINDNGFWLESDKHIDQWLEMVDNQGVGKKLI